MICRDVSDIHIYSASVEESATVFCFLDTQLTAPSASFIMYPVTDFRLTTSYHHHTLSCSTLPPPITLFALPTSCVQLLLLSLSVEPSLQTWSCHLQAPQALLGLNSPLLIPPPLPLSPVSSLLFHPSLLPTGSSWCHRPLQALAHSSCPLQCLQTCPLSSLMLASPPPHLVPRSNLFTLNLICMSPL